MSETVKEITRRAEMLPPELQQQALQFVTRLLEQSDSSKRKPFQSVFGIFQGKFSVSEEDISEMRREALKNFPREEPN